MDRLIANESVSLYLRIRNDFIKVYFDVISAALDHSRFEVLARLSVNSGDFIMDMGIWPDVGDRIT